jgi:thioredoxin 1
MPQSEEQDTGSLFGPSEGTQAGESKPRCSCRTVWKVAVVVALVVVVLAVIVSKAGRKGGVAPGPMTAGGVGERETGTEPAAETVLATVNAEEITLGELASSFDELPLQQRAAFERAKHEYLEELIVRKLLIQEARKLGIAETESYSQAISEHAPHPGHEEHVLVDLVLRKEVLDKVKVSEAELQGFYEEHKSELPGNLSLEEAKGLLLPSLEQQKQYEAVESYRANLRNKAAITRNTGWVEAQKALASDNPLGRALQTGRPVLADFGRGKCIPCKMMKPILDDLKRQYEGKAEILIIDIDEYAALTGRCRIRAIPTQIFYDASGKEVSRHEGFMPRADIVRQLERLGVK